MKKESKTRQLIADYEQRQKEYKEKIKKIPNKWKRFWHWIWFLLTFPFIWIFYNIRDWHTFLIFILVFLVVSCEVWVPYLIYFITKSEWWLAIGSACWIFWLGPGTPFTVIVISLTIAIKTFFNKKQKNKEEKGDVQKHIKNR